MKFKVTNNYRKKDFSYLLYNNPSSENNKNTPLPEADYYNKEKRNNIINRLLNYNSGKLMTKEEQKQRKQIFTRLGLDFHLIERLFVKYKAQLLSATYNQIIVFQNQDKWKLIRIGQQLFLYHNNYYVASDGTRYRSNNYHLQQVFPLEEAHKAVTKIVGYDWEKHKKIYCEKTNCFVSV